MGNRLSVKKAAELIGASEQFVRIGLQQGLFPWGYAVKMSGRWTYYISPYKFSKDTGIQVEGAEQEGNEQDRNEEQETSERGNKGRNGEIRILNR